MRSFVLYLTIGLLLLPLAALAGAIAEPSTLNLWCISLLFALFTQQFKLLLAAIVAPMIFAAKLAWPVTCFIFPITAVLYARKGPLDVAIFAVLGAVAGPVLVFALVKLGWPIFISPRSIGSFLRMAATSGAVLGAIFGYAVWRIDRITSGPAVAVANPT